MSEQLVSADPSWGVGAITPPPQPHPEARIGADPQGAHGGDQSETRPVTVGDLVDNPIEAISRIGTILKTDLSDPKTWLQAGLMYFGPKVFSRAVPMLAKAQAQASMPQPAAPQPAAPAPPGVVSRMASAVQPKDVEMLPVVGRPLGQAVDFLGRMKAAVRGAAPAEAPAAAAPPPGVEPSAPTPQASASVSAATGSPKAVQSPQRIQNELGLAARRAGVTLTEPQYQQAAELVKQGQVPTEAVLSIAKPAAAVKEKLSGAEFQAAQSLIEKGLASDVALKTVLGQREFAARFGLPTNETVRTKVATRNATGRWQE